MIEGCWLAMFVSACEGVWWENVVPLLKAIKFTLSELQQSRDLLVY